MKKVEIKELGIVSSFKATIYFTIVPCAIIFLLGLFLTIVGASIGRPELLFIGVPYLLMPVFMVAIYGLISMLNSLIYNKLAAKFGGLEVVIAEKQDNQMQYQNPYNYPPQQTNSHNYPPQQDNHNEIK